MRLLSVLMLLCGSAIVAGEAYRLIPIAKREHGYNNFESTSNLTPKEYSAFMDTVDLQDGWNGKARFQEAMRAAKIDFTKEALVLFRHTEGSGSVAVKLLQPELRGSTLVCKIERKVPEVGTDDMAYYCFAIVVDRSKIKAVECHSKGKKQTFRIVTPQQK